MQSNSFIQSPPISTITTVRDFLELATQLHGVEEHKEGERLNLSVNATATFKWLLCEAIDALDHVVKTLETQGSHGL